MLDVISLLSLCGAVGYVGDWQTGTVVFGWCTARVEPQHRKMAGSTIVVVNVVIFFLELEAAISNHPHSRLRYSGC